MKRAKEEALDDLCSQYCAATGKFVIVAQLVKVLNNIKAAVKTDTTNTVNTSIKDFCNGLQIPTKLSTRYQDIYQLGQRKKVFQRQFQILIHLRRNT